MTLEQFLDYLENNPLYVILYAILIPFAAFLGGIMGKGEGAESPWKYFYSVLVYLVCVPGILAIAFNVYLFLFERRSIMDTKIYTQILPIFSMIATLLLIKNNVSLDRVPGFGRLSGLMMMISVLILMMWFVEKTRIVFFSYLPIQYLAITFVVLLLVMRFGWSRMMRSPSS